MLPNEIQACGTHFTANSVYIRLLIMMIMSVCVNLLFATVSTVFALFKRFLFLIEKWSIVKQIGLFNLYNTDNKRWKKLFVYCCRGSIQGPHLWQPFALPIVLTCHCACFFSFAYICFLLCSQTFVLMLDNFILF